MAAKIEPGAPLPPQHRKQIADREGNFHPVTDEPTSPATKDAPQSEARPFANGDQVVLAGRVMEVHGIGGGRVSVKVQTANGAEWYQSEHLQHADASEMGCKVKELKARILSQRKEIVALNGEKEKAAEEAEARLKAVEAEVTKFKAQKPAVLPETVFGFLDTSTRSLSAPPENKAILHAPENKDASL